jgi:hypothetical protein
MAFTQARTRSPKVHRWAVAVLGWFVALLFLLPLWWTVASALRPQSETFRTLSPVSLWTIIPKHFELAHFGKLMTGSFGRAIVNSVGVTAATCRTGGSVRAMSRGSGFNVFAPAALVASASSFLAWGYARAALLLGQYHRGVFTYAQSPQLTLWTAVWGGARVERGHKARAPLVLGLREGGSRSELLILVCRTGGRGAP